MSNILEYGRLKRIAFDPKSNQYLLFERDENGICKKEVISKETVIDLYRNNVINSEGEFMADGRTYSLSAAPSYRTFLGADAGLNERQSGIYYGDSVCSELSYKLARESVWSDSMVKQSRVDDAIIRQNLIDVGQKIRDVIKVKPLYDGEKPEVGEYTPIPYPESRQEWNRLQKSFKWRFLKLCAWIDSWALGKEP